MKNSSKEFTFLDDRDSVERMSMAIFLKKLNEGFLALTPAAEMDLKSFVASICQHSYEMTQGIFDLHRLDVGLNIETLWDQGQ